MNETFFSIVIPVYNTIDSYLKDCFNSIERQNYRNYEVIVVDDGSNEETKNYLKQYEDKYRIVHHKTNSGIIVSRETGISNAKGDFIVYLDSDDILNDRALEILNDIIVKNSCDVIMFQTPRFTNDLSEVKPLEHFFLPEGPVSHEDAISELVNLHINPIADKCTRRTLLDFSDDNLDKNIINGEDLQQSTALILKTDRLYFTHKEICYYRTTNFAKAYYDVNRVNDVNYMVPPYKMLFVDRSGYEKYLPVYKKACVNNVIYNAFRIYEAKLPKEDTYKLLDKLGQLQITQILSNIKEKINFPSEFVFSLFLKRHYFLLGILARIYPIPH